MNGESDSSYILRPNFKQKFRPVQVTSIIQQVLTERLNGATYQPDTCSQWTREIADEIKVKLKELDLPRYKYIVSVTMGEIRGEGVRMGSRCFWDADTDNVAQYNFTNVVDIHDRILSFALRLRMEFTTTKRDLSHFVNCNRVVLF